MEETYEEKDDIEIIIKVVDFFDTDDPHFDVYIEGKKSRIDLDDEVKKYIKQWSA